MLVISSVGWKTLVMFDPKVAIIDELISMQRRPGGQAFSMSRCRAE